MGDPVRLRPHVQNYTSTAYYFRHTILNVGRCRSVGIATCYSCTVRGSNPGRGENFRTSRDRPWGPPGLLYNRYQVFPGIEAAEAWRCSPTPI